MFNVLSWQLAEPLWLKTVGWCLLVLAGYQYYARNLNYWKRRGINGESRIPLVQELISVLAKDRVKEALNRTLKYGKVYGIFMMGSPRLVVADPEVLRQICIRDFDTFPNHNVHSWANKFQRHFLVWLQGDHWKRVRAMISPQFTSSKMKRMYRLMDGCAEDLLENFREQMIWARRDGQRCARVDLFATYSMYTMDGITTCCYGLKLQRERGDLDIKRASARNALVRDCNSIFAFNLFRFLMLVCTPKFLLESLNFRLLPDKNLEPLVRRVERLLEARRQTPAASTRHDDLLQMLTDAKLDDQMELTELDQAENHHAGLTHESLLQDQERLKQNLNAGQLGESSKETAPHRALAIKLDDHEIVSEAIFLLAAGLDTTRSSMTTISYFLAHNPEAQERLYEELSKIARYEETPVGRHLSFDYDQLTGCQYLDAVISESLRLFGPASYTDRVAERDYYIEKYDIHVPKGERILLGLHSVANDPDYWHEPQRFDPDRFMPGRKETIVPGSYAPFSMGPRHCVGMRFSLTETKLGLAKVLMNYKFAPAPRTKYPPEPSRGLSIVSVKNPYVLVTYRDEANF